MQKVLTGEEPDVFAAANEGNRLARRPPPLCLSTPHKKGAEGFLVTNTSGGSNARLAVTANGEFSQALQIPLRPRNPDNNKQGSLKSPECGCRSPHNQGFGRRTSRSDQGRSERV